MAETKLKQVEFLPVLPLSDAEFRISDENARSIVQSHVEVTRDFPLAHVANSSMRGMIPYKAAVAMALADLGFSDLLSATAMQFSETDIERLEGHFPFLLCITSEADLDDENATVPIKE